MFHEYSVKLFTIHWIFIEYSVNIQWRAGTRPKQFVIVAGIYLGVWLCIGRVLLTETSTRGLGASATAGCTRLIDQYHIDEESSCKRVRRDAAQ